MVDEVLFNTKLGDLKEEKSNLINQRENIINVNEFKINEKIDEETKKFITANKEKFIYEVIGEELKVFDEKIKINDEIISVLEKLIVSENPKENELILEEQMSTDTNLS